MHTAGPLNEYIPSLNFVKRNRFTPANVSLIAIIHLSVQHISLISLFLHRTLSPYIAFTHTHSLRAVSMLIFAIQFTTLRLRQCSVFKISQQEKHDTMDFQYTGVQKSSLRVQIIADSKTCLGEACLFFFLILFANYVKNNFKAESSVKYFTHVPWLIDWKVVIQVRKCPRSVTLQILQICYFPEI